MTFSIIMNKLCVMLIFLFLYICMSLRQEAFPDCISEDFPDYAYFQILIKKSILLKEPVFLEFPST